MFGKRYNLFTFKWHQISNHLALTKKLVLFKSNSPNKQKIHTISRNVDYENVRFAKKTSNLKN